MIKCREGSKYCRTVRTAFKVVVPKPWGYQCTQQGKPRNYITYAMNLFVSRVMFHVLQIILDL